jgi:CRISPR-associated endonuclease/helicase Cas3
MNGMPTYQLLWAKVDLRDPGSGRSHPLICHMLDVAQVARVLWQKALTRSFRAQLVAGLDMQPEEAGRLLAFWAALHDLGKASPAFQAQYPSGRAALSAAGMPFPSFDAAGASQHGTISTWAVERLLPSETGVSSRVARQIAIALGGHHGAWPRPGASDWVKAEELGGQEWDTLRRHVVRALVQSLDPPAVTAWMDNRHDENTFLTLFSGLTAVANWIGSAENYFPYVSPPLDPQRYAERAAAQAEWVLTDQDWLGYHPPEESLGFEKLFPFEPSPMQQAVISLGTELSTPSLVLIEAPAGCGKTEAALYLADRWAYAGQQRGLHVAMPTRATGSQMHGRVKAMLDGRYGPDVAASLLVQGQAGWTAEAPPPDIGSDDEREDTSVQAMAWFLPGKRSLLAPFGVGSIDQSLLSVLQTRHFFVRLFGLSHKTVVFDEVHAYDTCQSALYQRLLVWLRAVGASVVLLTTALPSSARRELVMAYAGDTVRVPDAVHPAVTWASDGRVGVVPLHVSESRRLALQWIGRDAAKIVGVLGEVLHDGGCAAVVCNTVARAQQVYGAVREARLAPPDDLILFHSRTPRAWRDETERGVLWRFEKGGRRPQRAVLVGTQVIEQNLDLDFDVMVSELAPADLLLQRAGRLHRHPRPARPGPVAVPRLFVACAEDGELPHLGADEFVYEPYYLLRTYLALRRRDALSLPDEAPGLVEAVYAGTPMPAPSPAWQARLEQAQGRLAGRDEQAVFEALRRLVPAPRDEGLLRSLNAGLEEDAPAVLAALRTFAPFSRPAVSLVCLHAAGGSLNTEPDGGGRFVDLLRRPDAELTAELAGRTVSVTHRGVYGYYRRQSAPAGWFAHPLLHDHRVAVFRHGLCVLPGRKYTMRLSRELGLEILPEPET